VGEATKEREKEMKKDLSIIIPFAGEYPQAIFTIQAIAQSLLGKLDFEIIAVDNYCGELEAQWNNIDNKAAMNLEANLRRNEKDCNEAFRAAIKTVPLCPRENRSGEAIKASARGNEWLTYMEFDGRLSHWECKRLACEVAKADTFLFIDAHCIPSLGIDEMYRDYTGMDYCDQGTFHMPLTYKILEWHRLIYKMKVENEFYGYSFTGMDEDKKDPFEVPVMSCCGVMISREVLDRIGGWPEGMFAYGGGENFLNYSLAVTGMKKWIYPGVTLHHHGDRRDYHYTYDGTLKNRLLAHYLFGGAEKLGKLASVSKGRPEVLVSMADQIIRNANYQAHRNIIKSNTTVGLDQWVEGYEKGVFKEKPPEIIPLRKKKLHDTELAAFVGPEFNYKSVLAFNYYGLFKLSSGGTEVVENCKLAFPNIRTMKARVIHFNSVKMEHIKELAPELLNDFPDFKRLLVDLRGF
jgi:hypothetical protein